MRINIVGTAGSGKTTLSKLLAQLWEVPHIELDAIYWKQNWKPAALPRFRQRVQQVTAEERWIVDGNYRTKARDIIWQRAQTVVWLDYPLPIILWRVCQRSITNIYNRRDLWENGSRETLRKQFLGKNSFLLWTIATHTPRRRRLLQAMQVDANSHLDFVQLRSPLHTHMWLKQMGCEAPADAQSPICWPTEVLEPAWI